MSTKRRLWPWVLTIVLVVGGVAGNRLLLWMTAPAVSDTSGLPVKTVTVEIPAGSSFKQVAAQLDREHLILNRTGFLLLGKLLGAERKVHPGEYALHAAMRPMEILETLMSGRVVLHPVTIPEGYTVTQIADTFAQKGLADRGEFIRLARDAEFIRSLNVTAPTLEGYLFPDTYQIAKGTSAKDIIGTMVDGVRRVFTPELQARAREINMTMHQVLTLASVVEKETGVDTERELVATVFHNRLRKNIPLQSDPTVIYALSEFDGNLRKRDLSYDSPYNTYRHAGLPPGPIANPGEQAIRAALYPAPAPYLYFVSRNDGTHQFSATLAEHNQAVERYQRRYRRVSFNRRSE
jgi:UPF0755 protein